MTTPRNKFFIQHNPENILIVDVNDIEILEGEYIKLRYKFNTGDLGKLQQNLVEIEPISGNRKAMRRLQQSGEPTFTTRAKPVQVEYLKMGILEWSFTDEDTGEAIPVTEENIGLLDPRIGDALYNILNDNNPLS